LGSGDEHIDAKFVFLDGERTERADRIHNRDDIRKLSDDRHDCSQIAHATARGLVVNQGDCIVRAGCELTANGLRLHWLPPFELQCSSGNATALGDVVPLIGKRPVHAIQHLLLCDVPHGSFHRAPRTAGRNVNRILRIEEGLKIRLNRLVQRHKIGAPMPYHWLRHGAERFF
jgi:hypothetical protein